MTAEEAAGIFAAAIERVLDDALADDVPPNLVLRLALAMQQELGPALESPELQLPAARLLAALGDIGARAHSSFHAELRSRLDRAGTSEPGAPEG